MLLTTSNPPRPRAVGVWVAPFIPSQTTRLSPLFCLKSQNERYIRTRGHFSHTIGGRNTNPPTSLFSTSPPTLPPPYPPPPPPNLPPYPHPTPTLPTLPTPPPLRPHPPTPHNRRFRRLEQHNPEMHKASQKPEAEQHLRTHRSNFLPKPNPLPNPEP